LVDRELVFEIAWGGGVAKALISDGMLKSMNSFIEKNTRTSQNKRKTEK
jgi:hypothetical protein